MPIHTNKYRLGPKNRKMAPGGPRGRGVSGKGKHGFWSETIWRSADVTFDPRNMLPVYPYRSIKHGHGDSMKFLDLKLYCTYWLGCRYNWRSPCKWFTLANLFLSPRSPSEQFLFAGQELVASWCKNAMLRNARTSVTYRSKDTVVFFLITFPSENR